MSKDNLEDCTKFKIMHVFGPKIGIVKLSESVVEDFLKLTDDILENKNRKSFGPNLVSQIQEEPTIPIEALKKANLYETLQRLHTEYIISVYPTPYIRNGNIMEFKTETSACWIVSQQQNEYNPPHWHDGCTLSSVLYLKIPQYTPRNIPGKSREDSGHINFINNSLNIDYSSHLENGMISVAPEVGDMYIFPSRLLHSVNPFLGPGERRSVSMNSSHFMRRRRDNE